MANAHRQHLYLKAVDFFDGSNPQGGFFQLREIILMNEEMNDEERELWIDIVRAIVSLYVDTQELPTTLELREELKVFLIDCIYLLEMHLLPLSTEITADVKYYEELGNSYFYMSALTEGVEASIYSNFSLSSYVYGYELALEVFGPSYPLTLISADNIALLYSDVFDDKEVALEVAETAVDAVHLEQHFTDNKEEEEFVNKMLNKLETHILKWTKELKQGNLGNTNLN
ncbi:uncharacterized protein LOC115628036 [Scaptodrosophila lebanonensis]|uniref:Uncharacterized protein LOC115628036 n=1 Tax=Drosophila lebanonensis TaxID=7225 RepID=A0A6J2TTD6_DROLE|nr:uncharacterized protein LOC115628036 [Scaptodrosophila lebanonensis]